MGRLPYDCNTRITPSYLNGDFVFAYQGNVTTVVDCIHTVQVNEKCLNPGHWSHQQARVEAGVTMSQGSCVSFENEPWM